MNKELELINRNIKDNIEVIFAKAKCEVWKERLRAEECSLEEFTDALSPKSENTEKQNE